MTKLSLREQLFVQHYLANGGNAAAAARAAGYSDSMAKCRAAEWVGDPRSKPRIWQAVHDAAKTLEVTPERIQQEMARLAFADPRAMVHPDGRVKRLHELGDEIGSVVNVKTTGDVVEMQFKVAEKKGALDSLARVHGMFKDRTELSGAITLQGILREIAEMGGASEPLVIEASDD